MAGERGLGRQARLLASRRWREANAKSIALIEELRTELGSVRMPMVVSGCVGPRGDGYDPGTVMSAEEAQAYHAEQIGVFARSGADMVTAITMTNANEAVGLDARGAGCGDAGRGLLHGRDGRAAADGAEPARGDHGGGRCYEGRSGLLHDQLRPPDPLRHHARE